MAESGAPAPQTLGAHNPYKEHSHWSETVLDAHKLRFFDAVGHGTSTWRILWQRCSRKSPRKRRSRSQRMHRSRPRLGSTGRLIESD
eukprot:6457215-Amphidinium_carterae.1